VVALPRLIFANHLRGLAALSVVISHLIGAFWGLRDFIGLATSSPVPVGEPSPVFAVVSSPWLNFGPFGVGVFFLVSGLVIPISLRAHTRLSFMLARVLRIYPTYLAALLIEIAVLHVNAAYWDRPFPYSDWQIASNALLIHTAVGQPIVDLVNWTLCIELRFYLLMALFAPLVRRGNLATLFAVAGFVLGAHAAIASGLLGAQVLVGPGFWQATSYESLFLILLLVGVLFSFHNHGQLSTRGLVVCVTAMFAMFLACWPLSSIKDQFPAFTLNYVYGLMVFSILYGLRRRVEKFVILDFFAAISFPLYLVHALIGLSILKWLMLSFNMAYMLALALAFSFVVGLATLLHLTIETRTIALGRKLSRFGQLSHVANVMTLPPASSDESLVPKRLKPY
jgi:peptidoglycan/LPS O-acetylase OafA/YrhL